MRTFDELNSFEDYFSVMRLSKKQKDDRARAAEEFEDIFLYFLIMLDIEGEFANSSQSAVDFFVGEFTEAARHYNDNDDFLLQYVPMIASGLAETTARHLGEEYYTSVDRARMLAANEANTVLNRSDYDNAIALGYTRKRWLTERDNRVRPTHMGLEGLTIPIDGLFVVGNALMRFPHDELAMDYPEEISNCRCAIEYVK